MRPRIRFKHWWFKLPGTGWSWGVCLYPWIWVRGAPAEVPDRMLRHELEHFYQVQQVGWIKYYVRWLWLTWRRGYWNNPYEVKARAVEDTPLTPLERSWRRRAEQEHEQT